MRQASQDRYELKQKQLVLLKSGRTRPRRHPINAQVLMVVLGATYSWRVGLFVSGKLLAACCSEGSPSAKHVRTHSRVDTLQDLLKKLMNCPQQTVDVFDR